MKLNRLIKTGIIFLLVLGMAFGLYRIAYPNDFFLPSKHFENSPYYTYEKKFSQRLITSNKHVNPDLHTLLKNPDFYLQDESGWIKNNVKRTISVVKIGQSKFFIKRYNIKNFFDYITKCPFRSSKAFRSLFYADQFKNQKINTPTPIALLEKRIGCLWTSCYLVFEYLEGQTLETLFHSPKMTTSMKASLIKNLSAELKTFYDNKWVHRDLTSRNIYIVKDKLYFLDLDDMHSYAFQNHFFRKKFIKKHITKFSHEISLSSAEFKALFFDYI